MFQTNVTEKIKTHFMFNKYIFPPKIVLFYEIMWKNMVQPERPQMTIWRMLFACWIPKATDIQSEYVIFIAFPLQQYLPKHASVFTYTYIACLV